MPEHDWPRSTGDRQPGSDVIVWSVTVDDEAARESEQLLSVDELQRAAAYRFERDRRRFVVRRAALRAVLAERLQVGPERIPFTEGAHGKPELGARFRDAGLHFSVSHSQDIALIAVSHERHVGVDIEAITDLADAAAIARRYFSQAETAALDALAPDERRRQFFTLWTRKEAFVKATGEGLSRPLDSFDVSPMPEAHRFRVTVDGSNDPWSLVDLALDPGFAAAVAAGGVDWTVKCSPLPGRAR
jgi:4'-phosphopantetheinyl transferase